MSDITKEQVELMLNNHAQKIELSNAKNEVTRLREQNQKLITKLASEDDSVLKDLQAEVKEAVEDGAKANDGEKTELGEVLERVAGIEATIEELSSKFKEICSSIKTITPLEAGIGKMSTSSEEDVATDEEVEKAIEVLEAYIDNAGTLPEVMDEEAPEVEDDMLMSSKRKKALASKRTQALASRRQKLIEYRRKKELASKRKEVEDLKTEISSKKPQITSAKRTELIENLRKKYANIETSSTKFNSTEYEAGELAGRLFAKNR